MDEINIDDDLILSYKELQDGEFIDLYTHKDSEMIDCITLTRNQALDFADFIYDLMENED